MLPDRPEALPAAFAEAWMARDAAALAALFAEDADFVNVTGLWWHDRAAIERAHAYGLSTFFRASTLRVGAVRTRPLGPDHAVVTCRMTLTGQIAPGGGPAGPRQTVFTFVAQRTPAGWQAVAGRNTDIAPGKETHVAGPEGLTPTDYRTP
ncbi:MAG: SgcJ/EcaC family oxidoreductase [Pseudomonadota bacterium]